MFLRKMGSLAIMLAAFGLIACSDEDHNSTAPAVEEDTGKTAPQGGVASAPSSMNIVSGDYSCRVTSTENSVKINMRIEGVASCVSTVSGRNGRLSIKTEYWYSNRGYAREECENWKEEAEYWKGSMTVTCSSNTVEINEYDEGSLSEHEQEFESLCIKVKSEYELGEYDQYM